MKPEAQQIALLKALGWRHQPERNQEFPWFSKRATYGHISPPPLTLDLMAEAVEGLSSVEQVEWVGYLYEVARGNHHDKDVAMAQATKKQRLAAFLKTKGLWTE